MSNQSVEDWMPKQLLCIVEGLGCGWESGDRASGHDDPIHSIPPHTLINAGSCSIRTAPSAKRAGPPPLVYQNITSGLTQNPSAIRI